MKTGYKIAIAVGLGSLILAGVAFAGWGGGGYDLQDQAPWIGRGPGRGALESQFGAQGWGRGAGPRIDGPAPRGGNYAVCPRCGAPCPWGAGIGQGRGPATRFGRGVRRGPGLQGGPIGPWGQGLGRGNIPRRPGSIDGGWGRGFRPGRGGRGFPPANETPRGEAGRPGWRQQGDTENLSPEAAPQGRFWGPDRQDFRDQRRGERRPDRWGRGLRPWDGPGVDAPPESDVEGSSPEPDDAPVVTPEAKSMEQPGPQ